jgi:hypothetical protein
MRTPRIIVATAITLAVVSLCACSGFGRAPEDTEADSAAVAPAAAIGPVSAVTVTLSDQAQQLAAIDPRLNADEVAIAVEHELQLHQLYAPAAADVHRSLAITVQNFTNSLGSSTKILGFSSYEVMLNATIQVKGAAATDLPPFDMRARVRLTNRATDAEGGSLAPLYTRFAVQTVAALRGVAPPSQ